MKRYRNVVCGVLVLLAVAATAWAQGQAPITAADLARLDSTAADIRQQVTTLRRTDPTLAADVDQSLGDLSDEITYLRVKLRREGSVSRDEYMSLRDRLETLRIRASGEKVSAQPMLQDAEPGAGIVPVGAEFDVRLQTSLNSGTAAVEQRFEATTILDYRVGDTLLIPAGATVRGFVSSVRAAGKIDRRGSLTLSFDEIRIDGRSQRLRASVTEAIDPKSDDDARRVGTGAVVGAILGGIIGGGKGALLGVIVGGGGTIAATEGSDVDLPVGTILRVRVDEPLQLVGGGA